MTPKLPISYPYKPSKLLGAFVFVFFGAIAYVIMREAQTNDRGLELVLYKVISFSFTTEEATLFNWILAGLSALFSLLGLYFLYEGFTSKATLDLSEKSIRIPPPKLRKREETIVPYDEIVAMEVLEVSKTRILKIVCKKKTVQISSSHLPKKAVIDEIFELLKSKLPS